MRRMAKDRSEPICANCGWLGVRLRVERTVVEAHADYRSKLDLKSTGMSHRDGPVLDKCPVCVAGARNFEDDLGAYSTTDNVVLEAICKPCPTADFTKWQAGVSPQMLVDMRMLTEQREWQADEAKRVRDWQAGEAQKQRDWQKSHDDDADKAAGRRHWQALLVGSAIALFAALIGAAATLVTVPWIIPPVVRQNATDDSSPQPPSRELPASSPDASRN